MTLEETIPLMLSKNYKERLKAEYYQQTIRVKRFSRFVKRAKEGKVKLPYPWTLLEGQLRVMRSYRNIIKARLDLEGINLED